MWEKLKYFLKYYTIKEGHSPINGLYKVIMVFNKPRLLVGNMVQSGGLVRKIWHQAIHDLKTNQIKVKNALVLGLGCGDCAFEITNHYPKAKITGVEIDEHIVEAARCYFDLATIKNLNIAIAEGGDYVQKLVKNRHRKKFDLIIVDAYLNDKMPKAFRTKKFFNSLARLLSHNGVVVYNHLFYDQFKAEAAVLIKQLEKEFGKITLQHSGSNLLIFCWY